MAIALAAVGHGPAHLQWKSPAGQPAEEVGRPLSPGPPEAFHGEETGSPDQHPGASFQGPVRIIRDSHVSRPSGISKSLPISSLVILHEDFNSSSVSVIFHISFFRFLINWEGGNRWWN